MPREQERCARQDGGMAVRAGMQESRQSPQELQAIMVEARIAPQHAPVARTNGRSLDGACRRRQAEVAAYVTGPSAWPAQSGSGVTY
jgi:hypothetical protein